jgi:hypothetical protein
MTFNVRASEAKQSDSTDHGMPDRLVAALLAMPLL